MSYTCPCCGITSQHPRDEAERYCGRCHRFEDDEFEHARLRIIWNSARQNGKSHGEPS
jgi:hypothetical protein